MLPTWPIRYPSKPKLASLVKQMKDNIQFMCSVLAKHNIEVQRKPTKIFRVLRAKILFTLYHHFVLGTS